LVEAAIATHGLRHGQVGLDQHQPDDGVLGYPYQDDNRYPRFDAGDHVRGRVRVVRDPIGAG
jgi:hypothetical protein